MRGPDGCAIITAAIVADLAVLGVFKYANFLAYNLGLVLERPLPPLDIALPLGISFFTFHHIMYLVDLRSGKAPVYPLGRYALYIAFFPQAIAGPLARWSEVMHQFGRQVYAPGWQRQFCARHLLHRHGPVRKDLARRPDRAHHRSDLCAGSGSVRWPTAMPGWR